MSDGLCGIKGCDRTVVALGLCVNHWRMMKNHGSPLAPRPLSAINRGLTPEQKFWKSVEKTDGCWLWTAGKDRDGYGILQVTIHGVSTTKAHRFSYMLHTGEILGPHQLVMHSCDNPPCVNPDHLTAGTPGENTRDMWAKGRGVAGRATKITDDEVRAILRDTRGYDAIAAAYGIHRQHVVELKRRSSRQGVTIDPAEIYRPKRGAAGAARSKNLSDQDALDIRASAERGIDLAAKYGVSQQTITDIRKGRSWKHLLPPTTQET